LPFCCTRWLLGGPVALFICGLTSSLLVFCFAECSVHTVIVFVMHSCLSPVRQSPVWPWPGAGPPRLSSVAPGFNSLADPVCQGYTLTRATHGLDRDLVPLTLGLTCTPCTPKASKPFATAPAQALVRACLLLHSTCPLLQQQGQQQLCNTKAKP
jgi:hypothetical protein